MGATDKKWDCGAEKRESSWDLDFARGKLFFFSTLETNGWKVHHKTSVQSPRGLHVAVHEGETNIGLFFLSTDQTQTWEAMLPPWPKSLTLNQICRNNYCSYSKKKQKQQCWSSSWVQFTSYIISSNLFIDSVTNRCLKEQISVFDDDTRTNFRRGQKVMTFVLWFYAAHRVRLKTAGLSERISVT